MKYQTINITALAQERTLRSDFDFHLYHKEQSCGYYRFEELFEIVNNDNVLIDKLYSPFKYCEIGDVDKYGDTFPVVLDFSVRSLCNENYYKKIEMGDIIMVCKDDILISKVRPNLKKFVRVTSELVDTYFTSAFIHLRPKRIPDILYYCLRSLFHNSLMAISRQGKGYPTLSEVDLSSLRFNKLYIDRLILKSSQISEYIKSVEEQISLLKRNICSQQEIIDRVFDKEFEFNYEEFLNHRSITRYSMKLSDISDNPDLRFSAKFHRKSKQYVLNELARISNKRIKDYLAESIILGAGISPDDYSEDGDYKYVSMATIKNWEFNFDDAKSVSDKYLEFNDTKTIQCNDIVLARSGEGTIGKVALIGNNVNGVFADFIMRIRLKNYDARFAYYYFRCRYFQYLIEIYKKGLGNNTNIFPSIVQDFPLIDIPVCEQQRIADEIGIELSNQKEVRERIEILRNKINDIIVDSIFPRM